MQNRRKTAVFSVLSLYPALLSLLFLLYTAKSIDLERAPDYTIIKGNAAGFANPAGSRKDRRFRPEHHCASQRRKGSVPQNKDRRLIS